jgi:hypothetical protein
MRERERERERDKKEVGIGDKQIMCTEEKIETSKTNLYINRNFLRCITFSSCSPPFLRVISTQFPETCEDVSGVSPPLRITMIVAITERAAHG